MTAIPFVRNRFTWFAYLMLGYYAYLQAVISPAMPFLGEELTLSFTMRALHLSVFALGMMLAGWTADRIAARLSRRVTFWVGSFGIAVGAVGLATATTPALTIASAFVMGVLGSLLLVMIQASLADHHGGNRSSAIMESNTMASIAATLAPFLVSQFERLALGWRWALWGGVAACAAAWFAGRNIVIPEKEGAQRAVIQQAGQPNNPARSKVPLPRLFWVYWMVALMGVAVEWCTIFWAADFLERIVGFSRPDAVGAVAIFFAATVIGRFVASRLTRTYRAERLLIGAAALTLVGFPLFWLGYGTPLIALIGLFVLGLGIANLFPLTLASTTTVGAANPDRASGRTSLAAGLAILVAPQVLGTVADQIGIYSAFGITGGLAILVLILTVIADRMAMSRITVRRSATPGG